MVKTFLAFIAFLRLPRNFILFSFSNSRALDPKLGTQLQRPPTLQSYFVTLTVNGQFITQQNFTCIKVSSL